MKRVFSMALTLFLLAGLLVSAVPTAVAQQIEATEEDTILIAFSDFQDKSGINSGKMTLQKLLNALKGHGLKKADGVFMVGDLNASGNYSTDTSTINTNTQAMKAIRDVFYTTVGNNVLFAQGNHDLAATPGLAPSGNNDPASGAYGAYIIPEDQYGEWGNTATETKQAAAELKAYLDAKAAAGWKKPIFIINHIPLHWGNRTLKDGSGTQGYQLFNVLNEAGAKGLNIIYLFGHNHSSGYDDFLGSSAIYLKKGDQMEVAQGSKYNHKTETLNFTYMNAGYVGYNSSNDANADTALTLSVFLIRDNEVIITRYDINGVHNLKSKGIWHASFSEEGYNATPNTTVYASSRKVTATSDEEIEPPYYSVKPAPTTTTTTTKAPTTTTKAPTTTTKPIATSGSVETTTTVEVIAPTEDTTAAPTESTTTPEDPVETGTPSVEEPTSTEAPTEPTSSATATLASPQDEDATIVPGSDPFPLGLALGIGGGAILLIVVIVVILLIVVIVVILLIKRKK